MGLYAKSGRSISVNKLDDARKYLVGVQRDGYTMQFLAEQGFKKLDPSAQPIPNLRKLLAGRNDLWFSNNAVVASNLNKLGKDESAITLVFEVSETSVYIAFNKDTSDEVINRWQAALDQLVQEGAVWKTLSDRALTTVFPKAFQRMANPNPK
jgi:polar amino acid transport system substrate-binding protein